MTVLGTLCLSAVACGGDNGDDEPASPKRAAPAGPAAVVKVIAPRVENFRYRFNKTRLTVPAGRVVIAFDNRDANEHNFRVQTGSECCFRPGSRDVGGTNTIPGGRSTRATLNLRAGEYVFLCSLASHWNGAGRMRGQLTVT